MDDDEHEDGEAAVPVPAPSPAEVMAASTSASGAWTAEVLARWGVAWPPHKGWRDELARKHRLGLPVVPLPPKPKGTGPRRQNGKAERQEGKAEGLPVPPAAQPPSIWITDIGPLDPEDPPPWL